MSRRSRLLRLSIVSALALFALGFLGATGQVGALYASPQVGAAYLAGEVLGAAGILDRGQATVRAAASGETLESMEGRLLDLLNGERVERGLAPLEVDSRLVALARSRSNDMASRSYFAHVTPEGTMVFDAMNRQRIPYRLAGENLARNSSPPHESPGVAHRGFMNSPTHAENDLDPTFNKVGIGAAVSPTGSIYFTELFAALD